MASGIIELTWFSLRASFISGWRTKVGMFVFRLKRKTEKNTIIIIFQKAKIKVQILIVYLERFSVFLTKQISGATGHFAHPLNPNLWYLEELEVLLMVMYMYLHSSKISLAALFKLILSIRTPQAHTQMTWNEGKKKSQDATTKWPIPSAS